MMAGDLQRLRFVTVADVYKSGQLAGHLERTGGAVAFGYDADYLVGGNEPVASTLPLSGTRVEVPAGGLPAFFAGLLPEGHRLTVLKDAVKTSLDDELTLLLAVGADVPGDVQIVPAGEDPAEPEPLADATTPGELDFSELASVVDLHSLPGIQSKASASMLSAPLAMRGKRYILKLDPPGHPHLVANEFLHLSAAKALKISVAKARVVADRYGADGLLVERFDRVKTGGMEGSWSRLPVEDGTQILNLPPASKYQVPAEDLVLGISALCSMPVVAVRNLYLQFVFAWLTGNGDLHAKNVSAIRGLDGRTAVAPVYDVPCTLLYGDHTLALPVAGKDRKLKARDWAEFATTIGLPPRAALSVNGVALRAARGAILETLPFAGSPLNGALRELRHRHSALGG